MGQPFVGEIRMFAGNFAPAGWMFCDGQAISISEFEVLFQLIGTTYGGDGQSTYKLPDLRGRLPLHQGSGFVIGQSAGTEEVTLTSTQIPSHSHSLIATNNPADTPNPSNALPAKGLISELYWGDPAEVNLNSSSISSTGGSQPHTNLQPYVCINFIISMYGIFPSQT